MAHEGHIHMFNFEPCLELLAQVGETQLDDATRAAFVHGLSATIFDSEDFFSQPLGKLTVAVARGEDSKVHLRVEAPHGFGRAVEAVTHACATYRLEDY